MRDLYYEDGEWRPDRGMDRGGYLFHDEEEWMRRVKWYYDWSWGSIIKTFVVIMVASAIMTIVLLASFDDPSSQILGFVLLVSFVVFLALSTPFYLYVRWRVGQVRGRLVRGRRIPAMYEHGLEVPDDDGRVSSFIPYSQIGELKRQKGIKPGPVADRLVGREVWYSILDLEGRYIASVADEWADEEGLLMLEGIAERNARSAPPDVIIWGKARS